jgi:tRNA(Ile)-lysidine synthetase-like protein
MYYEFKKNSPYLVFKLFKIDLSLIWYSYELVEIAYNQGMDIEVKPGKYIVAVSGGVDSVVLLNLLAKLSDLKLTVAHFDHGIREDSALDRQFVQSLADEYDLPFVYIEGELGSNTSEAVAREARYSFLKGAQSATQADAIITAHHQDDLLETAILNMLRGTGRRGLSSLQSRPDIIRPLLGRPKSELEAYARANGLKWREDPSNHDTRYQRNYVRHNIMPRFNLEERDKLVDLLNNIKTTNNQVDSALHGLLNTQGNIIKRQWFNRLPHSVAKEMMAAWLRDNGVRGYDRHTIERLVAAAKTAQSGKLFPVMKGTRLEVGKDSLALRRAER